MEQKIKITCPNCNENIEIPESVINAIASIIFKNMEKGKLVPAFIAGTTSIDGLENDGDDASIGIGTDGLIGGSPLYVASGNGCGKALNLNYIKAILLESGGENDVVAAVVSNIEKSGKLYNAHLFKQHVLAQMFRMMTTKRFVYDCSGHAIKNEDGSYKYEISGYCKEVKNLGYDYTLTMLADELHRQAAMYKNGDKKNFEICNSFYGLDSVVKNVLLNYQVILKKYIDFLPTHTCKRKPYKNINGARRLVREGMYRTCFFVSDIRELILNPIDDAIKKVLKSQNPIELDNNYREFIKIRVVLPTSEYYEMKGKKNKGRIMKFKARQNEFWREAYMGYGAYWSMQNLIEFHNCNVITQDGEVFDRKKSMEYLEDMRKVHCNEGHWLYGMFKHFMEYNHIDIEAMRKAWTEAKLNK